jgi:hypothetical protein
VSGAMGGGGMRFFGLEVGRGIGVSLSTLASGFDGGVRDVESLRRLGGSNIGLAEGLSWRGG